MAGIYSNSTTSSKYNYNLNTSVKTTYHILGEDVEVDFGIDASTAMMISTLNVLGKPFYDELKKNKVSFSSEIEDFLKQKFKILERDDRIESILE